MQLQFVTYSMHYHYQMAFGSVLIESKNPPWEKESLAGTLFAQVYRWSASVRSVTRQAKEGAVWSGTKW